MEWYWVYLGNIVQSLSMIWIQFWPPQTILLSSNGLNVVKMMWPCRSILGIFAKPDLQKPIKYYSSVEKCPFWHYFRCLHCISMTKKHRVTMFNIVSKFIRSWDFEEHIFHGGHFEGQRLRLKRFVCKCQHRYLKTP